LLCLTIFDREKIDKVHVDMARYVILLFLFLLFLVKTDAYSKPPDEINYIVGPIVAIDTSKGLLAVENKSIDPVLWIDPYILILDRTGVIPFTALNINDTVSVEYRNNLDNKKTATQIVRKYDAKSAPQVKQDTLSKEVSIDKEKKSIKNDSSFSTAELYPVEESKKLLEKTLGNKTREELFKEVFKTAPPKLPKQIEATLSINEKTDGTIIIIFTDDRRDFSLPVEPVLRLMSNMVIPELLNKIKAIKDGSGRVTKSFLNRQGLLISFENETNKVKISVPSYFLLKQDHIMFGNDEDDPYSIGAIMPNKFSSYLNILANQQFKYYQILSDDSAGTMTTLVKSYNKEVRRPLTANFDGVINIGNIVFEGDGYFDEDYAQSFRRQNMRVTYDIPKKPFRITAGDISSASLDYQSSIPVEGICLAKDFSLQPYTITYPVSDHEFYVTNQSEAEIWVNDILIKKMVLDPGKHDIRGFPFSNGNNNVKIILTDFTGKVDSIAFTFQQQTSLLSQNFSKYSINAGFHRNTYNNKYVYDFEKPCISFFYSCGITNTFSADIYSRASAKSIKRDTLKSTQNIFKENYGLAPGREGLLGIGCHYAIPIGMLELKTAGCYMNYSGYDMAASLGFTYKTKVSYKNSQKKESSPLKLISSLSWQTIAEYTGPKFKGSPEDTVIKNINAITLSTNIGAPLGDRLSISGGIKYYSRRDTFNMIDMSLRIQKAWLKDLHTSLTFQYTTNIQKTRPNPQVIASINWVFHSKRHETSISETINRHNKANDVRYTNKNWDYNTGIQWSYNDYSTTPQRITANASAQLGAYMNDYNAVIGYSGNQGNINLTQDMYQPEDSGTNFLQHNTDLRLQTALVYTDKTLCFSRPIYSGFVIAKGVKNLKRSKIYVNPSGENAYESVTNILGPAVLPLYSDYSIKKIKLEPEDPPLGFVNEKTSFTLFSQYKSGFCLKLGMDNTVLVLGTIKDYDGTPFGYQNITIISTNDKTVAPVATFTNSAGRFQFLAHENQAYMILPTYGMNREPITFKIPQKNDNGFYQIGVLVFNRKDSADNTTKTIVVDTTSSITDTVNTGKIDTADSGATDTAGIASDTAETEKKSMSIPIDTVKASPAAADSVIADTNSIKWITVWGSIVNTKGEMISMTSITISYCEDIQLHPDNTIYYPNTTTNKTGGFQFVCRNTGEYKIVVSKGINKNASASFMIPAGTKGSIDVGTLYLRQ
jgi:outer membrane usher protein